MTDVVRIAREGGLRVTPQRVAIYRALAASDDHPDPDTLHRRLLGDQPSISLATVYKTLDALERLGLARRVPVAGAAKRYDANLDRHHHLICQSCQRVSDVYDEALDRVAAPANLGGFEVSAIAVQMTGTCAECARKTGGGVAKIGKRR